MAWTSYNTRWLDARITSDATYRAQGKWISDRLTDLGWGKTADTGQIDWTTAARAGAPTANTKGGYEIRVSSGAGTDVYIKISYGTGYAASGPCIGLWLQSGDGSDGAGTLTGDVTTERQVGSAFGSATPYESTWYLAGDADNFVFGGTHEQTYANGSLWGVQRSCDSSGVDTSSGWFTYNAGYIGSAVASNCQYVSFATGAKSADANPGWGLTQIPRLIVTSACPVLYVPLLVQDGSTYMALRDVMITSGGSLYSISDVYHFGSTRKYATVMGTSSSTVNGITTNYIAAYGVRLA